MRGQIARLVRGSRGFATSIARRCDRKDLVVIGGGSGGLACAREAASLGLSTAVLDWVEPSPAGSVWGIGGTCVNVGCIPKKLFHRAARIGESLEQADVFGWDAASRPPIAHDWQKMVAHVQGHVQSASFGYMAALMKEGIESISARGRVVGWDPSSSALRVEQTAADGTATEMLANNVVIAVGTRPRQLELLERLKWDWSSGRVITSDDLFSMTRPPGRTLVLGGGYVALECSGFLQGLGHPTTIANRTGTFLRGFDEDATAMVVADLQARGVRVLCDRELSDLCLTSEDPSAPLRATLTGTAQRPGADEDHEFDTVLIATGRAPLGLESLGALDIGARLHSSGKFIGGATGVPERISSEAALYAVGDVLEGLPELTPVAISQGIRVARMAAAASGLDAPACGAVQESEPKDHSGPVPLALRDEWAIKLPPPVNARTVPTAVFTPLEYACVGMTEDQARREHGDGKVDVVWAKFDTLEQQLAGQVHWKPDSKPACLVKLITSEGESDEPVVVGVHICGPEAGETIQGFAVAMQRRVTLAELVHCVGVHPTLSEALVNSRVTKRSGLSHTQSAC